LALLSVVAARCLSSRGWISPLSVFVAVFSLFHTSLAIVRVLRLPFPERRARQLALWIDGPSYIAAQRLVGLALVCLVAGAAFASLARRPPLSSYRPPLDEHRRAIGVAGNIVVSLGVALWLFVVVSRLGFTGFFRDYHEYIAATRGSLVGWSQVLIGFGLSFLAADGRRLRGRIGFKAFLLFAILALPLGLRGEVLFPVAAAVTVSASDRRHEYAVGRIVVIAAIVLPLLTLAGLTRHDRSTVLPRFDGGDGFVARLDPTDALVEMGSTIRVTVEAIRVEELGVFQFERFQVFQDAARFFAENLGLGESEGRIGVLLNEFAIGTSGIGSSPVAETYLSGGRSLILIFFAALGSILSLLERRRPTAWRDALTGVLLLPLLTAVRNEFAFVPLHWVFGLVLVGAAYCARNGLVSAVKPRYRLVGVRTCPSPLPSLTPAAHLPSSRQAGSSSGEAGR
jgi:hypothetical protein